MRIKASDTNRLTSHATVWPIEALLRGKKHCPACNTMVGWLRRLIVLSTVGVVLSHGLCDAAQGWPPVGPKWETNPSKALERSRKEQKPILAYVGNEGCPHCVQMATEVWPDTRVRESCDKVVCLAVHRNKDEEWVVRLNVMAYPQFRWMDGATGSRSIRYALSKHSRRPSRVSLTPISLSKNQSSVSPRASAKLCGHRKTSTMPQTRIPPHATGCGDL